MQTKLMLNEHSRIFAKFFPWIVWGLSSLFVTYQMLLQTAPSVMITDLEQAFSINEFGVSLLSSSFFYTYVLFQIPAGMLIDRVQPRYCLTFCFLAIAVTTILLAGSHSLFVAKLSRVLQGAFSALSVVPALYLAATWFPPARFALLAGLTEMIGMSGAAMGQIGLAPAMEVLGWRSTLLACALIGLALAVLTWTFVRSKPSTETEKHANHASNSQNIFHNLLTVISYRQAWINGLFSGLLFSVAAAFGAFWCIPFLMHVYGVSLTTAAAASSMTLFGASLGAPAIGWVSDKMGLRKLPMMMSTVIVLFFMLVILYVPALSLPVMFCLLFAVGFFSSSYALPFAVMRDIMPAHVRGTAMGYTNMMCILIGSPILQPLIGWLLNIDTQSSSAVAYQHALTALPICLAVALILSFFIQETYCGSQGSEVDEASFLKNAVIIE
ncbi:MAG: MFS transporter [Gammaproteobacteria bacterium]|nr:MFS transporter [Gammaproteobacteria bacterium]